MRRFRLLALADRARRSRARARAGSLNVVASFSILGDFVRNVGGDRVNVTTLVGPDSDVHVYTPAPADAKKIADAKLVIINGLGLEGWLPRLVQSSGSKAAIVTATNGIAPLKLGSDADPHAWQSVANAKIYVGQYPRCAGRRRSRGRRSLSRQCGSLSGETRCARSRGARGDRANPAGRRKVISTHDAFGYFAAAYGIEFIAPQGVSTESEASARDIAAIITQIRAAKIPGGFPGKYQRSAADAPDIGRDRRQDRRNAVFRQFDGRKGRCPHLH
jgi:zinc/manganese transport system substrate-binding protein